MKYSILMLHRTDSQFNLPFSQYWFVFHVYRWFSRPDRNCIHRWCWSRDLKKKHWTCRRLHNCWSISCAIALQYVSKLLTIERWLHINYMSDRNCSKVKKSKQCKFGFQLNISIYFSSLFTSSNSEQAKPFKCGKRNIWIHMNSFFLLLPSKCFLYTSRSYKSLVRKYYEFFLRLDV